VDRGDALSRGLAVACLALQPFATALPVKREGHSVLQEGAACLGLAGMVAPLPSSALRQGSPRANTPTCVQHGSYTNPSFTTKPLPQLNLCPAGTVAHHDLEIGVAVARRPP
jgi:hypothetical protein